MAPCRYFSNFWLDTQRLRPLAIKFPDRQQTTFPRLDAFLKREPPRHHHAKCRCGADDAWHCWSDTRRRELFGLARRDSGTLLLVDSEVIDSEDLDREQRQ